MSDTGKTKRAPDLKPFLNAAQRTNYKLFGIGLLAAFALAFLLAWLLFAPPAPEPTPAPPPPKTLAVADVDAFLQAVNKNDYTQIRELGSAAFTENTTVPDGKQRFTEFETTSYSPNTTVYSFHSGIDGEKARRILLTLDDNNRVVSFLAEEMAIVK